MSAKTTRKVNYLNNKDILKEIQRSKLTFCYVEQEQHRQYDIIVEELSEIDHACVEQAKINRASRFSSEAYNAAMASGDYDVKPKQKDFAVDPHSIPQEDLVFRVMTYDHIPDEPGRKRVIKKVADSKAKVNFPPFKQYVFKNNELCEVVRSHWRGDLATGEFCTTHGQITNELGKMFIKLVDRYGQKGNWRGYSYLDEMKGQTLLHLSIMGLQFNEYKSDNPFGYYTTTVTNTFTRVLNMEKGNQRIRDEILIDQGHLPSYSRQLEHEEEMKQKREELNQDQDK